MFQGFADNGSAASNCLCLCSVRKREGVEANFHTEFVIVRDLVFVSRGGGGQAKGGKRRSPLPVLSGSPEKRIMGLGCGVRLSLSGFDHTIASSIEKQKNSAGQNRLSLLRSHYAHCLSPRFSSSSLFSPLTAFLSLSLLFRLFSSSRPPLFWPPPRPHTHTTIFVRTVNDIMH